MSVVRFFLEHVSKKSLDSRVDMRSEDTQISQPPRTSPVLEGIFLQYASNEAIPD